MSRGSEMKAESNLLLSEEERARLRALVRQVNVDEGITGEVTLTAAALRERMRLRGINPDDRVFQRELARLRSGEDGDK
jgi:hypothetical protein